MQILFRPSENLSIVLLKALQEANMLGAETMGVEHVLKGLLFVHTRCKAIRILRHLGITPDLLDEYLCTKPQPYPNFGIIDSYDQELSLALTRAFDATKEAQCRLVGTEHLLVALSRNPFGAFMHLLQEFELTPDQIPQAYAEITTDNMLGKAVHVYFDTTPSKKSGKRQ